MVGQIGQTDQPGCPQYCFNLVPTQFSICFGVEAYFACFIICEPIFASFCHFMDHVSQLFHHSHLKKSPNMVLPVASCCVPIFFHPFQPNKCPLSLFVEPKGDFQHIFSPLLGPIGAIFGHSGSGKWAKLVSLDVLAFLHVHLEKRPSMVWPDAPCCVQTLFHPFQPK